MRKTMVIPTYWSRRSGEPWQEGDAIYDHPTPVDQEGTLERTLVSMKRFREKDFKLVILVCPTTEDVEEAALAQVRRIVLRSGLGAETYLFTAGDSRHTARRGAGRKSAAAAVHVRVCQCAQRVPACCLHSDGGRGTAH